MKSNTILFLFSVFFAFTINASGRPASPFKNNKGPAKHKVELAALIPPAAAAIPPLKKQSSLNGLGPSVANFCDKLCKCLTKCATTVSSPRGPLTHDLNKY